MTQFEKDQHGQYINIDTIRKTQAKLYVNKFTSEQKKGNCILFDARWMTPLDFEKISGITWKDWQKSVHENEPCPGNAADGLCDWCRFALQEPLRKNLKPAAIYPSETEGSSPKKSRVGDSEACEANLVLRNESSITANSFHEYERQPTQECAAVGDSLLQNLHEVLSVKKENDCKFNQQGEEISKELSKVAEQLSEAKKEIEKKAEEVKKLEEMLNKEKEKLSSLKLEENKLIQKEIEKVLSGY